MLNGPEFERDTSLLRERVAIDQQLATARAALEEARARRDDVAARRAARLRDLEHADQAVCALDDAPPERAPAVYLHHGAPDRGTLTLERGALRFDGWRGSAVLPLDRIAEVELGVSRLPPRAGVPLLGWLRPGRPRPAETLLLIVLDPEGAVQRRAVVADLADGRGWRERVLARQARLRARLAAEQTLTLRRKQTLEALRAASAELDACARTVAAHERTVAELLRREQAVVERQEFAHAVRRRMERR